TLAGLAYQIVIVGDDLIAHTHAAHVAHELCGGSTFSALGLRNWNFALEHLSHCSPGAGLAHVALGSPEDVRIDPPILSLSSLSCGGRTALQNLLQTTERTAELVIEQNA